MIYLNQISNTDGENDMKIRVFHTGTVCVSPHLRSLEYPEG